MAYVYRHIRLDTNQPFYIGIGSDKNYQRANVVKKRSNFWQNIYNQTLIDVEIIYDNISFEKAKEKEKEFIKLYGRRNLGTGCLVNLTDGGDGVQGIVVSDVTRKKISEIQKGKPANPKMIEAARKTNLGKQLSIERKEKIRVKLIGNKNGLGKTPTLENRLKLIECNKNRIWTDEMRLNMALKKTGVKMSDETKLKMKIAQNKRRNNEHNK